MAKMRYILTLFVALCVSAQTLTEWRPIFGLGPLPNLGTFTLTTAKYRPNGQGNGVLVVVYDWLVAPNIANNIVAAHYGVGYHGQELSPAAGLVAVNRELTGSARILTYRRGRPSNYNLADPCRPGFCASLMRTSILPAECDTRYCPPPPPRCGAADGNNFLVPRREIGHWTNDAAWSIQIGSYWESPGLFMSCDEYPFASTNANNGNLRNIRVSCVPDREQVYQGALMSNFYNCLRFHTNPATPNSPMPFLVAVDNMPENVHQSIANGDVPHFVMGPIFDNGIGYISVNNLVQYQPNTDWIRPTHPGCTPQPPAM